MLELNVGERWIELSRELRDPGEPSTIDIPINRKEVHPRFCVTLLPDRPMFVVRLDISDLPPHGLVICDAKFGTSLYWYHRCSFSCP